MSFDSRSFIRQLTTQPGVYRMYGAGGDLLYVGKARSLKKRVASYFLRASGSARIEAMVSQIARIEVTVTRTEDEALVLEANLIKELGPRYNVTLRDDKSYPYLQITAALADPPPADGPPDPKRYSRIAFYRGGTRGPHRYFGPYPSAVAVRETLLSLQKLFRLRPCSDTFFANRSRPCLQYQIDRCSGPCTRQIGVEEYARDVASAVRLLEGKGEELAGELGAEMERASQAQDYERAARVRDQVAALRRLQADRVISPDSRDVDVIAVAPHAGGSCVTVLSVRDGLNLGHRSFFPAHSEEVAIPPLLGDFLPQYYLERKAPSEVLVEEMPEDCAWLEHWLGSAAGRKVRILQPQRGGRVRLMEMARATAQQSLSAERAQSSSARARMAALQEALALEQAPQRLECFDISHTRGERTVASCVVFGPEGPLKASYRKFNIEGVEPGDDYGAIRQAVTRRYVRVKAGEVAAPDVLFIDGGRGQLAAALDALREAGVEPPRIVAVSKGAGRRPGLEQLHLPEAEMPLVLPASSPALHLVQQIRDEAHRFAITGHRGRREKARLTSALDAIEGMGPVRKRALLRTLGGLGQVKRASVDDLARVPGISKALAERIYAYFH
ncbi:MAG TPA: excinuclease ABC subunit UvrC [Candidatus Binatia bacterium]|nr:excinuclease ABC subunit UvrC [Candidatus Binatia bacterium]